MDTYDLERSSIDMLNQQIASLVFSCLPEDGHLAVILDGNGQCWPSDAQKYSQVFSQNCALDEIIAKIDDGQDPVITEITGTTIVATQLETKNGHCGYLVIALEGYTHRSTVQNIDLVEMTLSLMSLVARLIQKANKFQADQMRSLNYSRYSEPCFN